MFHLSWLAIWALTVAEVQPLEPSAMKAWRSGQLAKASWILELVAHERPKRRQSRASWSAHQGRMAFLAGRIAFQRKRYAEAISHYQRALKWPSLFHDQIYLDLAESYIHAKKGKEAADTFLRLLKEYGGKAMRLRVHPPLIQAYEMSGQWYEAAEIWRKLLWIPYAYGGRKAVFWKMAQAYTKSQRWPEASRWLRQFVLDYPQTKESKEALALLYDLDKKGFSKLASWTPDEEGRSLYRLSLLRPREALPQIQTQIAVLQQTKGHDPDAVASLRLWEARTFARMRDHARAIAILEPIASHSSNVNLRRKAIDLLNKSYTESGEYDRGYERLNRYAEAEPDTEAAQQASYRSIWMAMYLHKYAEARRLLSEYKTVYPEQTRLLKELTWFRPWTFFRQGLYKEALKEIKEWSKRRRSGTDRAKASYWTARTYERMAQWEKARFLYQSLASLAPLTYYGILSQHRLHLLDHEIKNLRRSPVCHVSESPKRSLLSFTPALLSKTPTWRLPWEARFTTYPIPERQTTQDNDEFQTRVLHAAEQTEEIVPFPKLPSFCRSSKGRSCRALQRAEIFASLGFPNDAAREIYEGRHSLRKSKALLLETTRWLQSNHAFHPSIELMFFFNARPGTPTLPPAEKARLLYPLPHAPIVLREARRSRFPFAFIWAIMREESLFRLDIRSWADALGLMQIIPDTAFKIARRIGLRSFQIHQLFTPEINIRMGSWYLGQLYTKFQGNIMLAAAAYNAGPHRVETWLTRQAHLDADEFVEEMPFAETREYVKRVFRSYTIYHSLYRQILPSPPLTVAVRVGSNIDF